ncbi:BC1881 family protein [Ornithinibacillus sp. JPR2-1]|uniref:BC1881 family protein n=1 Tax=Ornithinibacillus sp. JPR2-1 TaxID=2094019 RepID=UPI0031E11663
MNRVEKLNKYLETLRSVNHDGEYSHELQVTIDEIKKEHGIGVEPSLSVYSTKELHEELVKREGVKEFIIDPHQEIVLEILTGDVPTTYSVEGPVRVLLNQD